ncbi:IPT/TIG domain-containing protein [Anthocerotibacter panamensis]|uniref:IPT/TIG domain-containing protein n=1 Tax=Anthocerotibacter panamensis TaxID=2857077 RepID=UPI001C407C6E|nr:IPT/TIG domain-containing protein [Anthocerotibacter panamensis]
MLFLPPSDKPERTKRLVLSLSGISLLLVSSVALFKSGPSGIAAKRHIQVPASEIPQEEERNEQDAVRFKVPPGFKSFIARPQASLAPQTVIPGAPALQTTFEGINFDENAQRAGFFFIPPDIDTAAGPSHVIGVVNTTIEIFTKTGTRLSSQSLQNFFAPLTPITPTFDPKVVYDQYSGRFVVVTLEQTDTAFGGASNTSRILLAVSQTSDPTGPWNFFAVNSVVNIGGIDRWTDFPGIAVDEEAIYITGNNFTFGTNAFAGVRMWIVPKLPFYTGGTASATLYDYVALSGGVATTAQPAQTYGPTPPGFGTYLLQYSGLSDGTNRFLSTIRIDNPLNNPTFTANFIGIGLNTVVDNGTFPGVPQLGTTRRLASNDRRISQTPIWRNNKLYGAASTLPPVGPDAGQVTARWFIIDTPLVTNFDETLADTGAIGGEEIAPGTFTTFPSVSVDSAGNLAVSFAASAPSIFAGSYFTGRLASDPPGTTQPAGVLRAGQDFYIRTFTTSTTATSRWGDYTKMSLDPTDERTFWTYNEYALPRGTVLGGLPNEDGRWGTSFGSFALAPLAQAPTITSFSPTSGPVNRVVTITGTNFTGATTVAFGGVAAPFQVDSDTQIRTRVPAGAVTGKIRVATPNGRVTSDARFTVTP